MRQALQPHPDFRCNVVRGVEDEVVRLAAGRLSLRYWILGATDDLVLPAPAVGRADELWKHTCLEAFVRAPPGAGYRELNLSPGGQWAAYRFDGYREGMANADVGPPDVRAADLDFLALWDLDLSPDRPWQVGISAVIEAADGTTSYWALSHPPGRPDFHNADCFVLQLPAPEGP